MVRSGFVILERFTLVPGSSGTPGGLPPGLFFFSRTGQLPSMTSRQVSPFLAGQFSWTYALCLEPSESSMLYHGISGRPQKGHGVWRIRMRHMGILAGVALSPASP